MQATSFLHKMRRALVPMRKATIDTLLLAGVINIFLLETGVLLTYPWLILLPYALVYVLALLLRLRQAARQRMVALEQDQSLEGSVQERSSESFSIELLLLGGGLLGS